MLALLLVLSQAPTDVPVAIVIASRRDTSTAAATLVEQLKVTLGAQGISAMGDADAVTRLKMLGGVDPKACDGARLCLQKLAQLLQGVVIGVDVSKAGRLTAGHVEAVSWDRVDSLASDDLSSDAKSWNQKSAEAATAFALKLKPALQALNDARRPKVAVTPPPTPPDKVAPAELKAPPPADQPRDVMLIPEPPPTPPPAVVVEDKKASSLGPVPYVTAATGIVAIGAGIVCLVLGFFDRQTYVDTFRRPDGTAVVSSYTDAELRDVAGRSNLRIGLGSGLIGLGAALGITAAVLFMRE